MMRKEKLTSRISKSSLAGLLVVFWVFTVFPFATLTAKYEEKIDYQSYLLINLDTDQVLLEKKVDEQVAIASLTKMMTVLVVLEQQEDLNQTVTIESSMLTGLKKANASLAGFQAGEKVSVWDLLYGAMLPSGADAAVALAVFTSSSEESFAVLMNQKAQQLGMYNTNYENASGLDKEGQYSCAFDQMLLLKYALDNENFVKLFTAGEYQTTNGKHKFVDSFRTAMRRNGIAADFIYGAKTGYETQAGTCLASVVNLEGDRLLFIGLGNHDNRQQARKFLNDINIYRYYIDNYDLFKLYSFGDKLYTCRAWYSTKGKITLTFSDNIYYYLPKDFNIDEIELIISEEKRVTYRTPTSETIAVYSIIYQGETIKDGDIHLKERLQTNIFLQSLEFSENHPYWAIGLLVLVNSCLGLTLWRLNRPYQAAELETEETGEEN